MNKNNKSILLDRILFIISIPGALHFIYYLIIDKYSDILVNLFGAQIHQHRSELKDMIEGNFFLYIVGIISILVFLIFIFIFVLKKMLFYKQKKLNDTETEIVASDWVYVILGTMAPFLVCFIMHAYSQSVYRVGRGSENFQQREVLFFWIVLITFLIGYFFAVKFWLKHPSFKNKNYLLVIFTIIYLTGLFLFNLGIYLLFDGPFP